VNLGYGKGTRYARGAEFGQDSAQVGQTAYTAKRAS
jgi:hypothetical protein